MPIYVRSSTMPVPVAALSDWYFRVGAIDRLLPPWHHVEIVQRPGALAEGAVARFRGSIFGITVDWTALHRDVQPGVGFTDVMEKGPLAKWVHRHAFLPQDERHSMLEDRVDYELPWGPIGHMIGSGRAARELERMFVWRHKRTRNDLHHHAQFMDERLRIAVSGTHGMVGSALVPFLTTAGNDVRRIVREPADEARGDIHWNQATGELDHRGLEGLDAVVHLAGAGVADRAWTDERKAEIRASRVDGTRTIATAIAGLKAPPKVLVCASATGFYGSRDPEEVLTEESAPGSGFLPDVCRDWEAAAKPALDAGVRVVHLRIGIVLSARGGMLGKLYTPFKLGLGGPVGSGRQMLSWIDLDDLLGVIRFVISRPVSGAVNAVAPDAVSNRDFGQTLGAVLGRPSMAPLPAAAVSAMLGEMGRELLLGGSRVVPTRLQALGFEWSLPNLRAALRFETGRTGRD